MPYPLHLLDRWLQEALTTGNPSIRGQPLKDVSQLLERHAPIHLNSPLTAGAPSSRSQISIVVPNLKPRSNDERVLHCCLTHALG
jgi:hypothetical protein